MNLKLTWLAAALVGAIAALITANIPLARAQTAPPAGHECVAIVTPIVMSPMKRLPDATPSANVPAGWTPVGGAGANSAAYVVACRPVP